MRKSLLSVIVLAACGGTPRPVVVAAPPVVATTPVAAVAPAPVHATKVRTIEGITEYRLANGLQVLLIPDATRSSIAVDVTYAVGSRHEGYGETGMAHLIEHMMFKGTKRLREISTLLDAHGAQNNASTEYDRTEYNEVMPATDDNLAWTLEMEADRMVNSTFLESDLASEFSVVRNEFEKGENDPAGILVERLLSTAYLWHNYGKSVIGSRSDIERVEAPTLRAFYAKYYQPDNATLIVSGKIDPDRTIARIEQTFGAIPKPARTLAATYSVEPVQDGEREVVLRRAGDVALVAMGWHTVGGTAADEPALEAAMAILDREPGGRLYDRLVETKLAASVSGSESQQHDPSMAVIVAEVRDGKNLGKVEAAIREQVEGLGASKIDDKDVERWRAKTEKGLALAMSDSEQLALLLPDYIALGDWRTLFAYRDRVKTVTAADVARVAKTYFVASNRTTARFIPTANGVRAPLTESPDIAAVVKGIEGEAGKVVDAGEQFDATPATLEARTQRAVLKGGISAALLPKKTRGGKVTLALTFHFGDATSLQGKRAIAGIMGSMLARGTAKKSFQDISDLEDKLEAHVSIDAGADKLEIGIETLRDHLPAALDLAAEIARSPSFPAKELEVVKQESLAQLEQELQDPEALGSVVASQVEQPWPKADPRYHPGPAEEIAEIQKVTLADVKTFYGGFVGGGHGELAVIGDFDAAAIRAQVEQLFGTWQSKAAYARLGAKAFGVAGVAKTIDTKDKENALVIVQHDVAMRDADTDYPAWLVVGQVFGGDSASRVWQRLREKGGLSYGAYGWTTAAALDDVGAVHAEAIVAPANAAKAKAALVEELGKLATGAFTKDEVETAKTAMLKAQLTDLANDGAVLGMLLEQAYHARTFARTTELRAKIAAVTADDVARVAKKWVHPERLIVVEAGDQAKAAAGGAARVMK